MELSRLTQSELQEVAVLIQIVGYRLDWKQKKHEKIHYSWTNVCTYWINSLSPFMVRSLHFTNITTASFWMRVNLGSTAHKFFSTAEPDDNVENTFV